MNPTPSGVGVRAACTCTLVLSILSATFLSQARAADKIECAAVLAASSRPDSAFKHHIENPGYSIEYVLQGRSAPTWEAYNWLKRLLIMAESVKRPTSRELSQWRKKYLDNYKEFQRKSADKKYKFVDRNYGLFKGLVEVNRKLGYDIFVEDYITHAPDDTELVAQGEQTVKKLEGLLRTHYGKTGFSDPQEVVDRVIEQKKQYETLLELIANKMMVSIRRPVEARFWIPLTGFQNQRVTGTSGGRYDPDFRDIQEAWRIFQPLEDYRGESVRYKPNYGETIPDFSVKNISVKTSSVHYGPDMWIIKREIIESRATYTPIDSFSQPISSNGFYEEWNQIFIPWSHRELLAPYLMQYFDQDQYRPGQVPGDFPLETPNYGGYYAEVQIWGPLNLDHVSAFVFTNEIPETDFLKTLKAKGILVLDGRVKDMVVPFDGAVP